jgi:HlyD family secretion protein
VQRTLAKERFDKLVADRKQMTIESPAEGIVYYGKFARGKSGDSSSLTEAAANKGGIPANQVVMTIVQPRPTVIRTTAPENQFSDLRPGVRGTATPTGFPDLNLPVTLDDVSSIPTSPGSFDARLTVNLAGKTKLLVPGMTCKVKLTAYLNRRAIAIAPKSLITDELDDQKHSVQVLDKDGKPQERPVTVGRKTEKQVEIVAGLSEGDKVVLEPVKDQK